MLEPILIDTDAGEDIDDVLAIAFAARRAELTLLGCTTVSYDTPRRAALVRQVLDLAGRAEVPVAAGMPMPLKPIDATQRQALMRESRMNHCPTPAPGSATPAPAPAPAPGSAPGSAPSTPALGTSTALPGAAEYEDAITFLARTIESHPQPVTLIGIGPATNLATLLIRRPDLATNIKAIALMGGELELRRAEHNIASDDVAAQHLLSSGVPVFLGTWGVTRQVVMTPDDCQQVAQRGTPLCDALAQMTTRWHPHQSWKPGPVMYDLAPILWCFRPDLFTTKAMHVAVDLAGPHTRGWTLDLPGREPNAQVTTAMDAEQAKRMLMATLLG